MPFDLFRAPLEEAADAVADVDCSLCGAHVAVGFELGLVADVIVTCACGAEVALDADDREATLCPTCGGRVSFPFADGVLVTCEGCLAAGRAAFTKDTELGMVRWSDAQDGWTHGLPARIPPGWELSAPNEDGWVRVRVPREHLLALVRTPGYVTAQGERWLFCCAAPMAFVGTWRRERFAREAGDGDGRALFAAIVEEAEADLWEHADHGDVGIYVFACRGCGRRRAHWDCM
jgi:uncharacterized protein CbrC (UPF0167 family)